MASKEEKSTKTNGDSDAQQLQELYALMDSENLDSLELKDEESTVRLIRRRTVSAVGTAPSPVRAAASPSPVAAPTPVASNTPSITAPLAGVFYLASSPTSAPFVKEGDVVSTGQTLCIVEAMKVMNEIKAESSCKIVKIVAENSRPVAAGQPLFLVGPA